MATMFEWVSKTRLDVTWMRGPDVNNNYEWDETLPNQSEIVELINTYDPLWENPIINLEKILDFDDRPKVYSFCSKQIKQNGGNFLHIDYITGLSKKLFRKSYLVKGECQKEEFYGSYEGTAFSDLFVVEEHTFTRDTLGFATRRDTVIKWINNDESINPITKPLVKFYSQLEQINEGKTRRGNLIDNLQMPIIGLISIAMTGTPNPTTAVILAGRQFLFDYKVEFDTFVGESNKGILDCLGNTSNPKYLNNVTYSWIDAMTPYGVTIRQYLIGQLTI